MGAPFAFQPLDPATRRDLFTLYARGCREHPVFVHEGLPLRMLSVFRYEDLQAILRDAGAFSNLFRLQDAARGGVGRGSRSDGLPKPPQRYSARRAMGTEITRPHSALCTGSMTLARSDPRLASTRTSPVSGRSERGSPFARTQLASTKIDVISRPGTSSMTTRRSCENIPGNTLHFSHLDSIPFTLRGSVSAASVNDRTRGRR